MSQSQQTTQQRENEYVKRLRSHQRTLKAETELLELKERSLKASINISKLQPEWDAIEDRLRKEEQVVGAPQTKLAEVTGELNQELEKVQNEVESENKSE